MAVLTKKVLADKLASVVGTKTKATEVVNVLFEEVTNALSNGDSVDVYGFGKFEVKERAARTGLNPLTKETIQIAAKKVPSFKASKSLKDSVNK